MEPGRPAWESPVEKAIREAQERGEFDNLPGAGKPLPDFGDRGDLMWWVRRYAEREGLDLDLDEINDACDPDIDGDGVANEVDLGPRQPPDGPVHRDNDRDGRGDECDNCRFRSNPDQRDTNGNGTGDLCDWDIDGDRVRNEDDNCDFIPNPDQWDADRDGIGAA